MATGNYLVQCISGEHVWEVIPGSELEAKCIARAQSGTLDALPIGTDECPDCLEDVRERDRRFANSCGDFGCPFEPLFDDDENKCANGCMAITAFRGIKDSPYDGQLRGLMPAPGIEHYVPGVTFNGRPLFTP